MAVTVFIRYQLDPFKRGMFEEYSKRWLTIIPKCGGDLVGYFMPHEGTNNIAYALISFENLATYEAYRAAARRPRGHRQFQFRRREQIYPQRGTNVPPQGDAVIATGGRRSASLSLPASPDRKDHRE